MSNEFTPVFAGAAIAVGGIAAEHYGLWRLRHVLREEERYVIGVATVGAGLTLMWGARGDWRAVVEYWGLFAAAGVVVAHGYRQKRLDVSRRDPAVHRLLRGEEADGGIPARARRRYRG